MLDSWRAANFDPHVVLGLQRPATPEQITQAHRRLVREFHPDRHFGDPLAHNILTRINVARDTLNSSISQISKPEARYDGSYRDLLRNRQQDRDATNYRAEGQSPSESVSQPSPKRNRWGRIKTILWAVAVFVAVIWIISRFQGASSPTEVIEPLALTRTVPTAVSDVEDHANTLTVPPTSTPESEILLNESNIEEWRKYALALINDERQKVGLHPLILNNNPASQSHAEDMRDNCFMSPWGTDGLKPYMRYTLSGGEQQTTDIVHGANYCPTFGFLYERVSIMQNIQDAISLAVDFSIMESNIFDPYASEISIGFAYHEPNLWTSMIIISDFVEYQLIPFIHDDILQFKVTVKNGIDLSMTYPVILIFYDKPPHKLTRGQLHQTNCYWYGDFIAIILNPDYSYDSDIIDFPSEQCIDPYNVPIDAPEIDSYEELPTPTPVVIQEEGIVITADEWDVAGDALYVKVDLGVLMSLLGDGIYTINLSAEIDDNEVSISTYSIFVPPRTN